MDINNLKDLILIQRRYRFRHQELENLNNQLIKLRSYFLGMTENLNILNELKIFDNVKCDYSILLGELNKINIKLNRLPDKISLGCLKNYSLSDLSFQICELNMLVMKYMNHISSTSLLDILDLFVGTEKIYNDITSQDVKNLEILYKLFKPICVWDSFHHKSEIKYESKNVREPISKNMIETILLNNPNITPKDNNVASIVIGDVSLPSFLKNLTEIVVKDKDTREDRVFNFNHMEILCLFDSTNNKIKLLKNHNSTSLLEEKQGLIVYIRLQERVLVIQGILRDDILDIYKNNSYIKELVKEHKKYLNYEVITVPKGFKNNFMKILSLRDIIICSSNELAVILKKKYTDYKSMVGKNLNTIINEFLLASKYRKIDILNIFLCGTETDNKLAYLLYDILKLKDKKGLTNEIYNVLHYTQKDKLNQIKSVMEEEESNLFKLSGSDISYERRINLLNVNEDIKAKAVDKLKSIKNNFQGDNKAQSWLDGLLKIPFGVFKENRLMTFKEEFRQKLNQENLFSNNQIDTFINNSTDESLKTEWENYNINKEKFLQNVRKELDDAVYGHNEAKTQLERIFAQWVSGESKGAVLGLLGPPGTGKTSLAKNGLSKCLGDAENTRPFVFLPIGGSVNGSTLVGHNYTYVGSTWGRIVDSIITCGCMNPIIFIDEVDKISNTEYGKEIISILTHLTDSTQNDSFEDKYFSGIPFDLSKALFVFSFNDISLIDPILRDRITTIEVKAYTLKEKINIVQNYMLPEILKDIGFNKDEIIFEDNVIEYLINTYTNEAGVRKIKEKIVELVREINLQTFKDNNFTFPFSVTQEFCKNLFVNKPKMKVKKIAKEPEVGLVNGLYATTTGIGGLTIIQAMKYPSEKMLELNLTGQQGDVMKESADYALKIAYNLLSEEDKNRILENSKNKNNFGIHIHTPEAATKKDGPSAGAAMTLAIYSVLTNKKVNNKVALTGEIDLWKNVTAIGGVYAKLSGAKKAGVTMALIPKDNEDDLQIIRNENNSPEDDNFKVKFIENIKDVFDNCLINEN